MHASFNILFITVLFVIMIRTLRCLVAIVLSIICAILCVIGIYCVRRSDKDSKEMVVAHANMQKELETQELSPKNKSGEGIIPVESQDIVIDASMPVHTGTYL